MSSLVADLERALAHRVPLLAELEASATDCYRLFHGTVEGRPGLTIDRYGSTLLMQSFHASVDDAEREAIEAWYRGAHPVFEDFVYNDRSAAHSRVRNVADDAAPEPTKTSIIRELGVSYLFRARHRGHDPWLFLDLRVARRYVQSVARGRSVLNLFAYTCGVGTCAAVAGASRVLNVDFARSSLDVGVENAALNGVGGAGGTSAFFQSDFFPAVRQLSGLGLAKPRRHGAEVPTPRIDPESFDLVFLDPPAYAKGRFGVVDLVHDYGSVFKPSLLATREGGTLVCCNNVAKVELEPWLDALKRGVHRHGRQLRDVAILTPDIDFPSPDGRPPLKVAVLGV